MKKLMISSVLGAAALFGLAGCGGGGGGEAAPVGSSTGVLTDGPVGGIQYSTSSGVTGTTDAQGRFQYNPNDTVTFRIGQLTLGSVTATGSSTTITPLQIAAAANELTDDQRQTLVTNLLVLLQSLDSDGNPDNGLSIPATAGTAMTSQAAAQIVLTADPATFAASSTLGSLSTAAGGEVVSPEQALAHFKAQFYKDLAGYHLIQFSDDELIAFRFDDQGNYLMGEFGEEDDSGWPGIERGSINWNPQTGEISADAGLDTNGEWGLSHIQGSERIYLSLNDGNLNVRVVDLETEPEAEEQLPFTRVANGTGLSGAWALDRGENSARSLDVQQFLFIADGRYLMLDPVGDDEVGEGEEPCGGPGLEYGSYSFNAGNFATSAVRVDTNDCAGLHDTEDDSYASFSDVEINATAGTATIPEGEGEIVLLRPNYQALNLQ